MKYSEAGDEAALFHLVREQRDLPVIARFTVLGEPVSKSRARFTNYGSKTRVYTPEKTLAAERAVEAAFRLSAPSHRPDPDVTYGLTALFFHGTRQRRDVDNMLKLLLDGLNGVAWVDDNQVVEVSGRKSIEWPQDARTEILVYRVGLKQYLTRECACCGEHFQIFPGTKRTYCSKACNDVARRKPRAQCSACGKPVADRKSSYCSTACAGAAKRLPAHPCETCGVALAKKTARRCRTCWLANPGPHPRWVKP